VGAFELYYFFVVENMSQEESVLTAFTSDSKVALD
jgi:hypothetical protein